MWSSYVLPLFEEWNMGPSTAFRRWSWKPPPCRYAFRANICTLDRLRFIWLMWWEREEHATDVRSYETTEYGLGSRCDGVQAGVYREPQQPLTASSHNAELMCSFPLRRSAPCRLEQISAPAALTLLLTSVVEARGTCDSREETENALGNSCEWQLRAPLWQGFPLKCSLSITTWVEPLQTYKLFFMVEVSKFPLRL